MRKGHPHTYTHRHTLAQSVEWPNKLNSNVVAAWLLCGLFVNLFNWMPTRETLQLLVQLLLLLQFQQCANSNELVLDPEVELESPGKHPFSCRNADLYRSSLDLNSWPTPKHFAFSGHKN